MLIIRLAFILWRLHRKHAGRIVSARRSTLRRALFAVEITAITLTIKVLE